MPWSDSRTPQLPDWLLLQVRSQAGLTLLHPDCAHVPCDEGLSTAWIWWPILVTIWMDFHG